MMIILSPEKNVFKEIFNLSKVEIWQEDTDMVPDRNVTEESLDEATDTGEDNLVAVDNSVPAHEVHVGHWLAVPHQLRSSSPFCPAAPRGGDPRCYLV